MWLAQNVLQPNRDWILTNENSHFSGAYLDEPKPKLRFGLLKVFLIVITGLSTGTLIAKNMVTFLDKIDHFSKNDDNENFLVLCKEDDD